MANTVPRRTYCNENQKYVHFQEKLKDLGERYFKDRSLSQQINLTYLYLHDHPKFDEIVTNEHNQCFDAFKDSGIADYYYNTPLACVDYAHEESMLTTRRKSNPLLYRKQLRLVWPTSQNAIWAPQTYPELRRGQYVLTPGFRPACSDEEHQQYLEQAKQDKETFRRQKEMVTANRSKEVELLREIQNDKMFYQYVQECIKNNKV